MNSALTVIIMVIISYVKLLLTSFIVLIKLNLALNIFNLEAFHTIRLLLKQIHNITQVHYSPFNKF